MSKITVEKKKLEELEKKASLLEKILELIEDTEKSVWLKASKEKMFGAYDPADAIYDKV